MHLPGDDLIGLARRELRQLMGLAATPVASRLCRGRDANPHYEVGHVQRVARLRALCPPWLHRAGCAYGGVGSPDCMRQGGDDRRVTG